MNLSRRCWIAVCAAALSLTSLGAQAQAYPSKPVRLVVPFTPGGVTDVVARATAERLSALLGQQVIVDNRPGAGTMLASEIVARAPADGYTLLWAASSLTINPALFKDIRFDSVKDFVPVVLIGSVVHVLEVKEALPVTSVADLIKYAKAHPGKLSYASVGIGTSTHLEMELFKSLAGVDLTHVPYKGSTPAITDMLGDRIDVMFDALGSSAPHIKAGKIRALAIPSAKRSPLLPNVPTVAEAGLPGYEATPWMGLLAPAGTPPTIIARLNETMNAALQAPSVRSTFAAQGIDILGGTSSEFDTFVRKDLDKWAKVVKDAGIKAE